MRMRNVVLGIGLHQLEIESPEAFGLFCFLESAFDWNFLCTYERQLKVRGGMKRGLSDHGRAPFYSIIME